MTLDDAVSYKGKLKIITTNGNCRIGYIEEVIHKDEYENQEETEILFNTVDGGGYSIMESEIVSIDEAK